MSERTFNAPPKIQNAIVKGFSNSDKNIKVTSYRTNAIWETFMVFSKDYGLFVRGSGNNAPVVTPIYGTNSATVTNSGNTITLSGLDTGLHHIFIGGFGIVNVELVS